jgi:hypothetical protein
VVPAQPWLRAPTRTGPRAVAEWEPEPWNPRVIHDPAAGLAGKAVLAEKAAPAERAARAGKIALAGKAVPAGKIARAGRAVAAGRTARSGRWVRPAIPDDSTEETAAPKGSAAPGGATTKAARAASMRKVPQDPATETAAPSGPKAVTGAWKPAGTAIRAGRMMSGPAGTPPAAARVGGTGIAVRRGLTKTAHPAGRGGETACWPSGRSRTRRRSDRIPAPHRPDRVRRRSPRAARGRGASPSRVPDRRHSRRCACHRHHRSHH